MNTGSTTSIELWPAQEEYVAAMKEVIQEGGVGIFQSGTGSGKTLANLMAAFGSGKKSKVFYFTRTHQQSSQVIMEARRLSEILGFTTVHLAGRDRLCHIPEVYMSPWETHICRSQKETWRKGGISRYSAAACHSFFARKQSKTKVSEWKAQSAGIPTSAGLTDLIQFSNKNRCCAYFTARDLGIVRSLVVGSYQYGLNSQIRAALSMSLSGAVVILDEGHNLEDVCCAILSLEISSDDVIKSKLVLERYKRQFELQGEKEDLKKATTESLDRTEKMSNLLHEFVRILSFEKASGEEIAFTKGIDLTRFFQKGGIDKGFGREFFSYLNRLEKPYADDPEKLQEFSSLRKLGDFILAIQKPTGFGIVAHRIKKNTSHEKEIVVRWECLDPALVLSEVEKEAKALIICSGTLEPLTLTARIFGFENAQTKDFGSTVESSRILVFAMGRSPDNEPLSSEYKLRKSTKTYSAYARAIEKAASFLKGGILCFFPSYNFMDNVVEQGFTESTSKTIFIEQRSSRANERELRSFRQAVQSRTSAIFCAVVGGKVSEGADLPQQLSRGIIVCGIPFLPTRDPLVRLRKDYYNEKSPGLGEKWYLRESIHRAAQALGRGWRGKEDYSIGFLLDSRYLHRRNRQYIPTRFKNRILVPSSWDVIESEVKSFLDRVQNLH